MESFVVQIIDYVSDNKLYAHQGGPIILSQIENELGEGDDQNEVTDAYHEGSLYVDSEGQFVDPSENTTYIGPIRRATLQDYADWCGEIAKKFAPEVQWTMCNGLSANNTIQTCNAVNNGAEWLEGHGGNGRIQVDQPALCKCKFVRVHFVSVNLFKCVRNCSHPGISLTQIYDSITLCTNSNANLKK